jgi:hypothetical protein
MTLDLNAVNFAVDVAQLAEGLLGESAGPDGPADGCPYGDPHCYAPFHLSHQLCEFTPPATPAAPVGAQR